MMDAGYGDGTKGKTVFCMMDMLPRKEPVYDEIQLVTNF